MGQVQTLAFVLIDGKPRRCCPTCALRLEAAGLVQCFLTDEADNLPVYGYKIAEGHTLAECREFIRGVRH